MPIKQQTGTSDPYVIMHVHTQYFYNCYKYVESDPHGGEEFSPEAATPRV